MEREVPVPPCFADQAEPGLRTTGKFRLRGAAEVLDAAAQAMVVIPRGKAVAYS